VAARRLRRSISFQFRTLRHTLARLSLDSRYPSLLCKLGRPFVPNPLYFSLDLKLLAYHYESRWHKQNEVLHRPILRVGVHTSAQVLSMDSPIGNVLSGLPSFLFPSIAPLKLELFLAVQTEQLLRQGHSFVLLVVHFEAR